MNLRQNKKQGDKLILDNASVVKYENILQNSSIHAAASSITKDKLVELKSYAIFKGLKKKQYKKGSGGSFI